MDRSQKSQIRNLTVVIFSSLLAALLLAGILLYNYGPSGRYAFKGTLLAPELIQGLNYNDTNSKTGGMSRFVFGDIEYTFYDSQKKQWQKIPVSIEKYANFYQAIGNKESVSLVDDAMISLFNEGMPSKLILLAKTESDASWQTLKKTFQEVEFATNGNYFRVQLREDNTGNNWAYFYMPGILQKAEELLVGHE